MGFDTVLFLFAPKLADKNISNPSRRVGDCIAGDKTNNFLNRLIAISNGFVFLK
jgi:hypothetical protein